VKKRGGFLGLRLVVDGGEEQRIESRVLVLDDASNVAVAPDVAAAFEPGDEAEGDQPEHGPTVDALRDMMTVDGGDEKAAANENAERKDNGEMTHEPRATQGLANFSNAGFEDGACDHGCNYAVCSAVCRLRPASQVSSRRTAKRMRRIHHQERWRCSVSVAERRC